jgi:hypothetical protein
MEPRDRCYDFLNIFAKKIGEKIDVFDKKNKAKLFQNLVITLVFEKNAIFFAVNCDHNIDPGFMLKFDNLKC